MREEAAGAPLAIRLDTLLKLPRGQMRSAFLIPALSSAGSAAGTYSTSYMAVRMMAAAMRDEGYQVAERDTGDLY